MADDILNNLIPNAPAAIPRGDFGVLPAQALPVGLPRSDNTPLPPASQPIARSPAPIFANDLPSGPDLLDVAAQMQPLAELLGHGDTQMPLTAALFGGPGAGKSYALARLVETIRTRANAAETGGSGIAPLMLVQIDAAVLDGEAGAALGAHLCQALMTSGVPAYAELAHLAVETSTDPHDAAEAAQEKLTNSRLLLDKETRNLADMRARSAKLTESLLNDPAGTPLDAYVRKQRSTIDARLRSFGFVTGDSADTYRDLVRDLHESGRSMPGLSCFSHALWAFKGQTKRIVWAILFAALGAGLSVAIATKTTWLDQLLSSGPNSAALATWLALHESWLGWARDGAFALAGLCLLSNLVRAWRFARPLTKGLVLLRADIDAKRSALETLMVQQGRRVETLTQDIARQERIASNAEQRAAASGARPGHRATALLTDVLPNANPAQAFIGNLANVMGQKPDNSRPAQPGAPRRILLAIDNLDGVSPARTGEIMEAANRVFSSPLYGIVLALDPRHVASVWPDSAARLDKLVQIGVQIGRNGLTPGQSSALLLNLLGHTPVSKAVASPPDSSQSILDRPITVMEARLLAELAPLAGRSARTVKRFVNLFRLVRAPASESAPAAALMLALDIGGTPAEIDALRQSLGSNGPDADFIINDGGPRLASALQAVRAAYGGKLNGAMMMAGLAAASPYMRR